MKSEYKSDFIFVKSVINKFDPINLLRQGAPEDEYHDEIQRIVSGLRMCNTKEEIQRLIYDVFQKSFGQETAGEIELYLKIAAPIFDHFKDREKC